MINVNRYIFGKNTDVPKLLDLFPADLSFSLCKLSNTYTGNCINVLRDSDNTEMEIGFVGDVLDVSTLMSFVGSANGYIKKWFNQSSSNDATQSTIANMPIIVSSGTLETLNGKPCIYFDGTNDYLIISSEDVSGDDFSVFSYGKRFASGSIFAPLSGSGAALLHFANNYYYFQVATGYLASNSTDSSNSSYLLEGHSTPATKYLYKNQVSIPATFNSTGLPYFFNRIGEYAGSNRMKGYLTEVILYKSNQLTDKVDIGNNIIDRNS